MFLPNKRAEFQDIQNKSVRYQDIQNKQDMGATQPGFSMEPRKARRDLATLDPSWIPSLNCKGRVKEKVVSCE
jgi:hypothetical protein